MKNIRSVLRELSKSRSTPTMLSAEIEKMGWIKKKKFEQDFYYLSSDYDEPVLVGSGETKPTPAVVYQTLLENPDWSYNEGLGFFWRKTEKNRLEKNAVELPNGSYMFLSESYPDPNRLTPMNFRSDEYVRLDQYYLPIESEIKNVLANREVYKKAGTLFKRGWLFFGKPGYGKTTMLRSLLQNTLPKDSITFFLSELPSYEFLQAVKDDTRLKVIVFEELASMLRYASTDKMDMLLNFLDGEFSFDNCLIFATTNYPESLPSNIIDRRSRFDRIIKVEGLTADSRQVLLEHYLKRHTDDTEIEAVKDFSIADIKEICLISAINGVSLFKAIDDIKEHKRFVAKHFEMKESVGIHAE